MTVLQGKPKSLRAQSTVHMTSQSNTQPSKKSCPVLSSLLQLCHQGFVTELEEVAVPMPDALNSKQSPFQELPAPMSRSDTSISGFLLSLGGSFWVLQQSIVIWWLLAARATTAQNGQGFC